MIVTDVRLDTGRVDRAEIRSDGGEASAFASRRHRCDGVHPACERIAARSVRSMSWSTMPESSFARQSIAPRRTKIGDRVMDVNVNGIFNVVHAWLPALRQTRGTIINVASIASFVGVADTLGYSPSKGAVKLFTQALARDLASDGIRVNAIAPGVIETPMTASTREDPDRLAGFMKRTPLGRVGQPEELIGPVIFLASSMASYVNGVILPVDGGFLAA